MKRLICLLASVFLFVFPAPAQTVRDSVARKSKKVLVREYKAMAAELDSLRALVDEYRERLRLDDSLRSDLIEIYEENEDKIAAGPQDDRQTDSLISLWYLHRQASKLHEGEGFDMDSIHFESDVPDSVYLKRLARMNSYITLPYNSKVRDYIILYSEKMPTRMQQMLGLSEFYFPIFEETFDRYGMPEELKYMAVIESALNPTAVSRANAKGMWQFMHNTARSYGLTINSYVDERLDPVKSADAAARYLRDAYKTFGDWNLAISSYNCGSGNVLKAIRRSGSRDFWDLYEFLPRETRGYVPAFVGAMYAFNYYKEHGMTPTLCSMPAHVDTIQVRQMLHFQQVSEVVGIPVETLRELNPQSIHDIVPGADKPYTLRIPFKYTGAFIDHEDSVYTHKAKELFSPATLENIKNAGSVEAERIVYKVKSGDYLGRIAARYHVSVSDIKRWNGLRSNNLRIGQRLVIYKKGYRPSSASTSSSGGNKPSSSSKPSSGSTGSSSAKSGEAQAVYVVKAGDTLYDIAKNYPGVSADNIMKFNGITSNKIHPGLKLRIPKP